MTLTGGLSLAARASTWNSEQHRITLLLECRSLHLEELQTSGSQPIGLNLIVDGEQPISIVRVGQCLEHRATQESSTDTHAAEEHAAFHKQW